MLPWSMAGRKAALAVVSVVLLASMGGGFLLLPILVPAHVWAARRSGRVGRVLWSALPVATAGMVVWAIVYVAVGEAKPLIWLLPALASVAAVAGMSSALYRWERRESP
jgi:hypothetical protein